MLSVTDETEITPTRVLAVVLNEDDWRAFLEIEPNPVGWVQQRIRERLESAGRRPESTAVAAG
jgi:hypothetical protein